jgi:rhodanese-related sulfurtransferase
MPEVQTLTPTEFIERWPNDASRADVVLLDVREREEIATAALPFARHIAMAEVRSRLDELDSSKALVVMCHGGARSMRVAQFLATHGFNHVFNLTGGIDAWSREIDNEIPRY